MKSLTQIDVLRAEAAKYAASDKRKTAPEVLWDLEDKITAMIVERANAKICPFCGGAFAPMPTAGRLGCIDCGATALVGRCTARVITATSEVP